MKKLILLFIICSYSALAQNYVASWNASIVEPFGAVKSYSIWWERTNSSISGAGNSFPMFINSVNVNPTNANFGGQYSMKIPIGVPNAVNLYLTTDGATNSGIFSPPVFFETNQLNLTAPLVPPGGFAVKLVFPIK